MKKTALITGTIKVKVDKKTKGLIDRGIEC